MRDVVIVGAARTPIGSFLGALASVPAPRARRDRDQGRARARRRRRGATSSSSTWACVLPAGVGQAPARQAALFAGLPQSVPVRDRQQGLRLGPRGRARRRRARSPRGEIEVGVAGGMESMSNAPHVLAQLAQRHQDGPARDRRHDGHRRPVGSVLEPAHGQLRRAVREGAATSRAARRTSSRPRATARARRAEGRPVQGRDRRRSRSPTRRATIKVETDEEPGRGNIEKLGSLRTGVPEGRHDHRRQRIVDQRRRRRARADVAPTRRRSAARKVLAQLVVVGLPRAGARVVHHRAGRRRSRTRSRRPKLGRRRRSTSGRSTRRSRSCRSRTTSCSASTRRRSTSGAARSRSATRSAPRARACSSRCCTQMAATQREDRRRVAVHRRRRRHRAARGASVITSSEARRRRRRADGPGHRAGRRAGGHRRR